MTIGWRRHVSRNPTLVAELGALETLDAAILAWNTHVASAGVGAVGMITLLGGRTRPDKVEVDPESRTWAAPSVPIQLPQGARLYLVSAGIDVGLDGSPPQTIVRNTRAIVVGDIEVVGASNVAATRRGGLWLDGIGLRGNLQVLAGQLETLDLAYCTIEPNGGIDIASAVGQTNAALELVLQRTISGPITATTSISSITLDDSLISAGGAAIQLAGAALVATRSTILGTIDCRTAEASDCIFADSLTAEQHQLGCLRFCYVAPGGQTPRPFRCQPRLALEGVSHPDAQTAIRRRIQPSHVSVEFGEPGFGLLHPQAPIELRTGAEDGAEIGVFHHLQQSRREARLRDVLQQYLRFGLEAGLFIES